MTVLVVGAGSIGQRHIRNVRARFGSSVRILACRTRGLSALLTEDRQIVPGGNVEEAYSLTTFDRLDEALAAGPDAVFVCTPTRLHVPVAFAAAEAGCHLLVEKPLSDTMDGVDALIESLERHGRIGMMGYQLRFHPGLERVKALIGDGAVGRLLSVRVEVAEYLPAAHPYEDYRASYAARADLGGGVVLCYSHELDYVFWLFGMPTRVFAIGGRLSSLEIDVEDTASISMECLHDGRPVPVHLHQDFVQRPPRRSCEIVGEAGRIVLDLHHATLDVFDSRGNSVEHADYRGMARNDFFLRELDHFVACMEGNVTPAVTIRDGAQSLRMALAARRSLATGEAVVP